MSQLNKIKIALCGQKYFGQEVLKAFAHAGFEVVLVSAPPVDEKGKPDRLFKTAMNHGIKTMAAGKLNASTMPAGIDLIVCAHSHDFIGQATRGKSRLGAIGYHPSLLPLHRGRDAVYWAIRLKEPVTGGSVYWLSDKVDGGPILAQGWCFIRKDDTPSSLWQRELQPMGVALLVKAVKEIAAGTMTMEKQDEALATWEPSVGRPPLFRPDLPQIGCTPPGMEATVKVNRWGAEKSDHRDDVLVDTHGFK